MIGWLRSLMANRSQVPSEFGRAGAWPRVRAEHLQREPACMACGKTGDPEVHHIIPVAEALRRGRPELELDPENLITLCAGPCHLVHGHLMNFQRFDPSVRTSVAAYRARLEAARREASSR